jgi:hypothetical protein
MTWVDPTPFVGATSDITYCEHLRPLRRNIMDTPPDFVIWMINHVSVINPV